MWERMVRGFHRSAAAFAAMGSHVMLDHLLLTRQGWKDLYHALDGLDVMTVGLECSLEELERRELLRAALPRHSTDYREVGMARSQLDRVHAFAVYDLVIDMTTMSTEHAASLIRDTLTQEK